MKRDKFRVIITQPIYKLQNFQQIIYYGSIVWHDIAQKKSSSKDCSFFCADTRNDFGDSKYNSLLTHLACKVGFGAFV